MQIINLQLVLTRASQIICSCSQNSGQLLNFPGTGIFVYCAQLLGDAEDKVIFGYE